MKSCRHVATIALLAGAVASPSLAADRLNVEIGGEITQYFGYANNDDITTGDFTGFDIKTDSGSVLTFGGDFTLDTGLQVGGCRGRVGRPELGRRSDRWQLSMAGRPFWAP
jgi:hypothetical protein